MVRKIVARLKKGGYHEAPQPLQVADVTFRFDAVLEGPRSQANLVLIARADRHELDRLWRRMKALTLVLDRTGSARPVTLVLLTPEPEAPEVAPLEELSAVIGVAPDLSPGDLAQRLRTLLALELPRPLSERSGEEELRLKLPAALRSDPVVKRLVDAAGRGADKVEETFLNLVAQAAGAAGEDEEEDR